MAKTTAGTELVKFGKYKGQPVEVMIADRAYTDWLLAQPWFKEKHVSIYQTVINYGGPPQDSPEHNQMQAQFLDEGYLSAFVEAADTVRGVPRHETHTVEQFARGDFADFYAQHPELVDITKTPPAISNLSFEDQGWDVTFTGVGEAVGVTLGQNLGCLCPAEREPGETADPGCASHHAWVRRLDTEYERNIARLEWIGLDDFDWAAVSYEDTRHWIELKPDLGDDYPAVLREVKTRRSVTWGNSKAEVFVIARRADFAHVTWDQVVRIFANEGVYLMHEKAIVDRLNGP